LGLRKCGQLPPTVSVEALLAPDARVVLAPSGELDQDGEVLGLARPRFEASLSLQRYFVRTLMNDFARA
jgi:hypothetical protein